MESPISTENKADAGHKDRDSVEPPLVDRAKDVLKFCGLKEESSRLESALDQVRRRLYTGQSKLVHPSAIPNIVANFSSIVDKVKKEYDEHRGTLIQQFVRFS